MELQNADYYGAKQNTDLSGKANLIHQTKVYPNTATGLALVMGSGIGRPAS